MDGLPLLMVAQRRAMETNGAQDWGLEGEDLHRFIKLQADRILAEEAAVGAPRRALVGIGVLAGIGIGIELQRERARD